MRPPHGAFRRTLNGPPDLAQAFPPPRIVPTRFDIRPARRDQGGENKNLEGRGNDTFRRLTVRRPRGAVVDPSVDFSGFSLFRVPPAKSTGNVAAEICAVRPGSRQAGPA